MSEEKYKKALEQIIFYQNNPIRRVQYAGSGGYAAPDWILTKEKIFEIAKKALSDE